MPSKFLEIKRKARRILHDRMHLDAFLFSRADMSYENPLLIKARLHYDYKMVGDQSGTNYSYAERSEQTDIVAIIYKEEVVNIGRDDVLSFDRDELFKVAFIDPKDDETIKVHLKRFQPNFSVPVPQ